MKTFAGKPKKNSRNEFVCQLVCKLHPSKAYEMILCGSQTIVPRRKHSSIALASQIFDDADHLSKSPLCLACQRDRKRPIRAVFLSYKLFIDTFRFACGSRHLMEVWIRMHLPCMRCWLSWLPASLL